MNSPVGGSRLILNLFALPFSSCQSPAHDRTSPSYGKHVTTYGNNWGSLRTRALFCFENIFSAASSQGCIDLYAVACDVMGADYTSSATTNQQSAASNCI